MHMNVFLKATVACLFLGLASSAYARQQTGAVPAGRHTGHLKSEIRRIIRGADADVGVAVISDDLCRNGKTDIIRINDHRRYPLMSVMKMHQALHVTDSLSRAGLPLGTLVTVTAEDLKKDTYSPLRDSLLSATDSSVSRITISLLLKYTLQLSDNNACDILFRHFGGPSATDTYIRSLGLEDFSIQVTEDQMHRDMKLCSDNWSRPSSAAWLLWMMSSAESSDGPAGRPYRKLSENRYLDFVVQTMMSCTTGQDRLAAPLLGTGAVIGHKTGTGDTDSRGRITGLNDIGIVTLPDGKRYAVAVLIKDSGESPAATAQIIADISEAVYKYMTDK